MGLPPVDIQLSMRVLLLPRQHGRWLHVSAIADII